MKNIIHQLFTLTIILLLATLCQGYDELNQKKQIMAYYEEKSCYPMIHMYYNRHFAKSKQFQMFLDVVEEAEYQIGDFAKILLTDCQKQDKSDENYPCKQLKRLNENRMIMSYFPSNQFTNFGDKIMQSPPSHKIYDHYSDIYTAEEIINYLNQMLPNFFKQIRNIQEFQQFKKPRYAPKLIYATRDNEVPQVIKQLGVAFFLKFDMGYVEDLTESVVNQLQISKFPALIVLKHNYKENKLEKIIYNSNDFSDDSYLKIKKFLQPLALSQPRNDYIFHLIRAPKTSEIHMVDNEADLQQAIDKNQGWIILSEGPTFERLMSLKQKYGLYYSYIHFLKPSQPSQRTFLYNPRLDVKYPYNDDEIQFRTLSAEDFKSNSTVWLKKDYIVVGVRQSHGHICTIVDKALFAGHAQCFIVNQNAYEEVSKFVGIQFEYGFIVVSQHGKDKVSGNQISKPNFQDVFHILEYSTRMKVKQIIDDFVDHPVKGITQTTTLQSLCHEPFKKCVIYFDQKSKDTTNKQYLQLEAIHFVNQYKIFDIDLSCNQHILKQIPQLEGRPNGLIAYHPRLNKYVWLKAKLTRSIIKKFLQINNQEKKVLPFRDFVNGDLVLNGCGKSQRQPESENEETQFGVEL